MKRFLSSADFCGSGKYSNEKCEGRSGESVSQSKRFRRRRGELALNVKVMTFKQARANSGSCHESFKVAKCFGI